MFKLLIFGHKKYFVNCLVLNVVEHRQKQNNYFDFEADITLYFFISYHYYHNMLKLKKYILEPKSGMSISNQDYRVIFSSNLNLFLKPPSKKLCLRLQKSETLVVGSIASFPP